MKLREIMKLTGIRVEAQAVDFGSMSVDCVRRLRGVVDASVPNHQLLIIGDGAEQRFVQQMPCDVFDDSSVSGEDVLCVDDTIFLGRRVDVPQANGVIVRGRQQVSVQVRIPRQTVAFLLVAAKTQVWVAFARRLGLARMLGVVKDENVGRWSLGGDDAWVLWHVASTVDFSFVVDLNFDFNFTGDGPKAPKLALFVVVVAGVELEVFVGQLNAGDKQMVLFVGRVSAENQAVDGIVLAFGTSHVGQPLSGERWPLESVRHDQVVEERSVLLPDFVFLVDDSLLDGIVVEGFSWGIRKSTFY